MDNRLASEPNDLARFFVERANDGDLEGLVALYEPRAVLAGPEGEVYLGLDAIRDFYGRFLATRPKLTSWRRFTAPILGSAAARAVQPPSVRSCLRYQASASRRCAGLKAGQ